MWKNNVLCLLLTCLATNAQIITTQELYPWRGTRQVPQRQHSVALPELLALTWRDSGGPEGHISVIPADTAGGTMLDWKINIDHFNAGDYPIGWPSFEARPQPVRDFSGHGAILFKIRALKDVNHQQNVRFILKRHEQGLNQPFPVTVGDWQQVVIPLKGQAWLTEVDRIHFFICEDAYNHGEELEFQIKDFMLADMETLEVPLAEGRTGASLWVGERADNDNRIVMLPVGTADMPAVLHVENSRPQAIPAGTDVQFRLTNIFTGKTFRQTTRLPEAIAAQTRQRVCLAVKLAALPAGYYHILADILRDGVSLLETRKGSDDFYLTQPGESMTYSMLSVRTGMSFWVKDLRHGGFMHSTALTLPHSYDPLQADKTAYSEFLRHFVHQPSKVCEGYEAGMPGLAIAAEAFRRNGDATRQAFTETLLDSAIANMLAMQDDNGGVITAICELGDEGCTGGSSNPRNTSYNSDQIGEWMRGLTYATMYYHKKSGHMDTVRRLNSACRKAGNFLFAHCLQDSDGFHNVIRHHLLSVQKDQTVKRKTYHQEGRQCDVYQPRLLAGLAYTAYTLQKCGETVPAEWFDAFDSTVAWMTRKMKPNGWFDWQCEDIVEGGCHTFLGNIYAGEGLFGVYLAAKAAGRSESAAKAAQAARKAYRYVTDDCYIRGKRYQYPTEFWVGPYVYWLFTEWQHELGKDEAFQDWLTTLDRTWSIDRKWKDFMRFPTMNCGRANYNSMLTIAILGYLGIKHMDEIQQPWEF